MAYTQLPWTKLSANSLSAGLLASLSWLQATAMAPMNAPAKQPKKVADDIGIGTREMTSATMAPQNGDKLRIAEMIIGWALLRPKLYNSRPLIPIANMIASGP